MRPSFTQAAVAATLLLAASVAQAYVTENVVSIEQVVPPFSTGIGTANYLLHFGSRPAAQYIDYTGGVISYALQSLDATSWLFVAQPGDLLTDDTLFGSNSLPPLYGHTPLGNDFYIGSIVDTGILDAGETTNRTLDGGYPIARRYGWAHVVVDDAGTLNVTASAIAYSENGIIVGTIQTVPEPGTWLLTALGLIALTAKRTRCGTQRQG